MRIILKLLFGLGAKEEYDPTPLQLLVTAIGLLTAFFGVLFILAFAISNII